MRSLLILFLVWTTSGFVRRTSSYLTSPDCGCVGGGVSCLRKTRRKRTTFRPSPSRLLMLTNTNDDINSVISPLSRKEGTELLRHTAFTAKTANERGRRRCRRRGVFLCRQTNPTSGSSFTSSNKNSNHNDDDDHDDDDDLSNNNAWALRSVTFHSLTLDVIHPQLLADFLMEIGATSTSIIDHDRDTDLETPIYREPGIHNTDSHHDKDDNHHDEVDEEKWKFSSSQIPSSSSSSFTLASDEGKAAYEEDGIVLRDEAVGTNVWKRCDVIAHFPSTFDMRSVAQSIQETFGLSVPLSYTVQHLPEKRDWVRHVQKDWKPILTSVNSNKKRHVFVLRFPWHTDEDVTEAVSVNRLDEHHRDNQDDDVAPVDAYNDDNITQDVVVELKLEGGAAFGTGEHPTTRLCLDFVADTILRYHDDDTKPVTTSRKMLRVMDYGCGSGILGMAAEALSEKMNGEYPVESVGVDIDADAIRIADANAEVNGLAMKSFLPPLNHLRRDLNLEKKEEKNVSEDEGHDDDSDETSYYEVDAEAAAVLMRGTHRAGDCVSVLPKELDGPIYDLCVANILTGPLVHLAPVVASLVKTGGKLGLSGILSSQASSVVGAYEKYFDNVMVTKEEGGWVLITGTKH